MSSNYAGDEQLSSVTGSVQGSMFEIPRFTDFLLEEKRCPKATGVIKTSVVIRGQGTDERIA